MDTFNQMFSEKFLCMTLLNLKYRGWLDNILHFFKKTLWKFPQKAKTLLYEHQCNNGSTEINFRKIFYNMRGNSFRKPECLVIILIITLSYEFIRSSTLFVRKSRFECTNKLRNLWTLIYRRYRNTTKYHKLL
jgi:hypothetical protein